MIIEDLVNVTKEMKEYQKKKEIKQNHDVQNDTDNKYRLVLSYSIQLVAVIKYLYEQSYISYDEVLFNRLKDLLSLLEQAVNSGLASAESTVNADKEYKNIVLDLKKNWPDIYQKLTKATISTLEAIKEIDYDHVENCLDMIKEASIWENDINIFKSLTSGLSIADDIINKMGLDDDIILFLQKANNGKATLLDLNEKVLKWLKDEKIENKIRITF